jgi:hypothetical protein
MAGRYTQKKDRRRQRDDSGVYNCQMDIIEGGGLFAEAGFESEVAICMTFYTVEMFSMVYFHSLPKFLVIWETTILLSLPPDGKEYRMDRAEGLSAARPQANRV